ncbi:hypothetical protein V6N12_018373 [Hibiscus sabdariffa]|uniref:Uncharacterized protein n=1 Tax=Hibiscus sabdariffa TaxID=183260 RepID=A0ABR2BQH9_9ROSI
MASQKLTQYELKRLENIKRNAETMAALNIHSKAAALAGTKRQRGIWGWDDSYIFIANMKKGVRVISATQKRTIRTLQSPQGSSIPYRFDTHPYEVGLLAGATLRSHVCLWTPS